MSAARTTPTEPVHTERHSCWDHVEPRAELADRALWLAIRAEAGA
ncbi:hypothetical protein ABZ865_07945 [Streptomyces sp. NPDC047085]